MSSDLLKTTDDMFIVEGITNVKLYGYPLYFFILGLYSFLTVQITGTSYIVTPISWMADMLSFYLWHVQAHHVIKWIPYNIKCHHWHNLHHHLYFPPKYFYGSKHLYDSVYCKEWIKNSQSDLNLIRSSLPFGELKINEAIQNESFGIFLVGIGLLVKYFVFNLTFDVIALTVFQGLLINLVGNYLHLSFHIKDHWLNKYTVYKELKYLHYKHHKYDTKHNYSIFFFGFDIIFNTYY